MTTRGSILDQVMTASIFSILLMAWLRFQRAEQGDVGKGKGGDLFENRFLKTLLGRIHDPAVDVPKLLQAETVNRTIRILERMRHCLARALVAGSGTLLPACNAKVPNLLSVIFFGHLFFYRLISK